MVPDWSEVCWYIYRMFGGHVRVVDRELRPGQLRAQPGTWQDSAYRGNYPDYDGIGERLVAVVKRCSLRIVRELLRECVPPERDSGAS